MLQLVSLALLALASAMTLELRAADAAAVAGDLTLPEFCANCASPLDDFLKTRIKAPLQSLSSCQYNDEIDCGSFEEIFAIEIPTEIVKSIDDHRLSELLVSQDNHQENVGCSYFESRLRDQSRVRAECNNIEPVSGHRDLASVVTLTTVTVGAFALLAGVWLLHRLLRNWRLRSLIPQNKRASDLPVHHGRRHSASR